MATKVAVGYTVGSSPIAVWKFSSEDKEDSGRIHKVSWREKQMAPLPFYASFSIYEIGSVKTQLRSTFITSLRNPWQRRQHYWDCVLNSPTFHIFMSELIVRCKTVTKQIKLTWLFAIFVFSFDLSAKLDCDETAPVSGYSSFVIKELGNKRTGVWRERQ